MTGHKWLDRRVSAPGPYLTLVRSESAYLKALRDCGANPVDDWIKTDHADATAHYLDHKDGSRCVIVALRASNQSPIEIAGLLVHESVHVMQEYFRHIGEQTPGSEQQAYAVQGIAQALMAEYARQISLEQPA